MADVNEVEARNGRLLAEARGVWQPAGTKDVDLGALDCYSQAELDACAAKKENAPSDPCDTGARPAFAVVEAGMNCRDCFTDCYCRGRITAFVCR